MGCSCDERRATGALSLDKPCKGIKFDCLGPYISTPSVTSVEFADGSFGIPADEDFFPFVAQIYLAAGSHPVIQCQVPSHGCRRLCVWTGQLHSYKHPNFRVSYKNPGFRQKKEYGKPLTRSNLKRWWADHLHALPFSVQRKAQALTRWKPDGQTLNFALSLTHQSTPLCEERHYLAEINISLKGVVYLLWSRTFYIIIDQNRVVSIHEWMLNNGVPVKEAQAPDNIDFHDLLLKESIALCSNCNEYLCV